jgi:hypothetical protein
MNHSNLFRPSAQPAGRGITIGTPRLYDLSAGAALRRPAPQASMPNCA